MASASAKREDATLLGETNLPLEEAIRMRAHEIWFQNGGQNGSALIDWIEAEKEILDERKVVAKCLRCVLKQYFLAVCLFVWTAISLPEYR